MSENVDDIEWLARELLSVTTSGTPDSETVAAVQRQLDAVRLVLRFDAGNAPSESALRRAEAIFQPVSTRRSSSITERLRAALTFDSRTAQPRFGFRGASASSMLRYEVDDILIDLEIRRTDSSSSPRFDITGQVDGAPEGPIIVELRTRAGDVVAASSQDQFGSFSLTAAPSEYDLVVRFGTTELTAPALVVG